MPWLVEMLNNSTMKKIIGFILCITSINLVFCQNFSAKIINSSTQEPVSFATVQTGKYSGVISNEEGVFNLGISNDSIQNIYVSCIGYQATTISIQNIVKNNYMIFLDEVVNELETVYLVTNRPKVDSIIARVKRNIYQNYKANLTNHDIFYRETSYMDFQNLDFEIEKASHVKKLQLINANKNLNDLTKKIIQSKTTHFTEFIGNLAFKDSSSSKLNIEKANRIINTEKDFSIEQVQKQAQNIVLKYLDSTKTYKLKTGLIKIEDSLSLQEDVHVQNDMVREFELNDLKEKTQNIIKYSQFYDNSFITNILDENLYNYVLKGITVYEDELIYIINYIPKKSKSKYTGTLYVSDESYALLKLDFQYAEGKRGKKLNLKLLLGIKYIENLHNGTIIYEKSETNIYRPRYIKYENGNYFYVNRPLKFIENSSQKNKTLFNFMVEGHIRSREELLFNLNEDISLKAYNAIVEPENVPYQLQKRYDSKIWKNKEVLAPSEELKRYQ